MKAKLAKTKINDSVTTGKSATGPGAKNFSGQTAMQNKNKQPLHKQDLMMRPGQARKPGIAPKATPQSTKKIPEEEDEEDDIYLANERMKQAAQKFS